MTDGNTKMPLCTRTIAINPDLLNPTMRYTPISNDLVSTLISNSEYISKTDMMIKSSTIRSKISPRKSTLNVYEFNDPSKSELT